MSFQRPSKDPTTWQAWTAHDHTAAAQRLWEMALLEFTGVHTVKVSGLLQEAEVHLCRAKILLVQREAEVLSAPSPVVLELKPDSSAFARAVIEEFRTGPDDSGEWPCRTTLTIGRLLGEDVPTDPWSDGYRAAEDQS